MKTHFIESSKEVKDLDLSLENAHLRPTKSVVEDDVLLVWDGKKVSNYFSILGFAYVFKCF